MYSYWTINRCNYSWIVGVALAVNLTMTAEAMAQNVIVPDGTLGAESSQVETVGPMDLITGGATRGQNLFHSFEAFNVSDNGMALFVTGTDITNIIARVTGGNPSNIFGLLGTLQEGSLFLPDANLFLINPNGIVFGPKASLNVGGSFTATTASSVQFGNLGEFSTLNPQAPSPLLTIDPSAYFFNQLNPGKISTSSINNLFAQATVLQVPDGETLTLLGGDITIDGGGTTGGLNAWGGRIELGSVGGQGMVSLNPDNSLDFPDNLQRGDISIENGAQIDVRLNNGGDITIIANNIQVLDNSLIVAGIYEDLGTQNNQAGDLIIQATGDVQIDQSSLINRIPSNSSGAGGDIKIITNNLEMTNGAQIDSSTYGSGDAGNIILEIADTARFDGISLLNGDPTGVFSNVESGSTGDGGTVQITSANLDITNGAQISASTIGAGDAGDIVLNIAGIAHFDGVNPVANIASSGAFSTVLPGSTGNGGDVLITARTLEITNGAQVNSGTFGKGNSGDVILNIADTITLDGVDTVDGSASGVFATVASNAQGNAGNIQVTATDLQVGNGSQFSTVTYGQGDAGNITINIAETANFDGVAPVGDSTSGAFSTVGLGGTGEGGNVVINTTYLNVVNGAQLGAGTFGKGNAGDIVLTITETARFDGVNPNHNTAPGGALSTVEPESSSQGGNVLLTANNLEVINGAQLNTSTFGTGDAGNIVLNVANTAHFEGDQSGALSQVKPSGSGDGGNIEIIATNLDLVDGAVVSAQNLGIGNAGDILLNIQNQVFANDGTIATNSKSGAGGQIEIIAGNIFLNSDSDIDTFVLSGSSGGGDITLTADLILAFDDSDILAFSADGKGGNITLQTPAFFGENFNPASLTADPARLDGNGRVDINATGAVSGIVSLPDTGLVENSLSNLPDVPINTDQLLAGSCIARAGDRSGSFVITGSGGLPARPGESTVSVYPTGQVQAPPDSNARTQWQPGDPITEPTGVFTLVDGRLVLSRDCDQN